MHGIKMYYALKLKTFLLKVKSLMKILRILLPGGFLAGPGPVDVKLNFVKPMLIN